MLMGTAGVVVGGVVAYVVVHGWLPDDAWKSIGALAGAVPVRSALRRRIISKNAVPQDG